MLSHAGVSGMDRRCGLQSDARAQGSSFPGRWDRIAGGEIETTAREKATMAERTLCHMCHTFVTTRWAVTCSTPWTRRGTRRRTMQVVVTHSWRGMRMPTRPGYGVSHRLRRRRASGISEDGKCKLRAGSRPRGQGVSARQS